MKITSMLVARLFAVGFVVLLGSADAASANPNPSPISVPLLGTQGAAGPYPSTITVVPRGGTAQTGQVIIRLLAVTHPCPEDLAILLVHNGNKYLLMSNAGSCRPLVGTNLTFSAAGAAIPDSQVVTPAYGQALTVNASNYGPPPVFPSPAPPGPYIAGMPPANVAVGGTWQLYVFDTAASNRGVIAGWHVNYPTDVVIPSGQTNVALPGAGTGPGGAASHPITFDGTTIPEGVPVTRAIIAITLRHTFPDDIRLVLESPAGTAVALMANAGGDTDIAPGSILTFADGGALLTDAGAIVTGVYSPGAVFGLGSTIPPPAPPTPHATTLASFIGQSARGTWRLWAFDDASADSGLITSATLTLESETFPNPTIVSPVTTATQPLVPFEIEATGAVSLQGVTFRVTNAAAPEFVAAGVLENTPGTNRYRTEVPLKKGANTITYRAGNLKGQSLTTSATVTVNEFTYSLAEGATGDFFDTDVTVANPTDAAAPVTIDLLPEGGSPLTLSDAVPANAPRAFNIDTFITAGAVSTVVHSPDAVPLTVERTMIWDGRGYGGHGGGAVAPHTRWLFAEGSQGYFDTYVLLANDNSTSTDVTVRYLVEGGSVVTTTVTVPEKSRYTIYAGHIAALNNGNNTSFGIDVTSVQPIIAERAMYLPGARWFEGGHESAGVNETSTQWFLAEGATGSFFDTYVLLSNPSDVAANVTLTYLLPSGQTIPQTLIVPPNSRRTINVEWVDSRLADVAVSVSVVSDIGIVVERAMYWPDSSLGWREAHNSFGVTRTGLRWGLADGRIGGPRNYQTFILLANPNTLPAEVDVRFLTPTVVITRTYTIGPSSRYNIWANVDVPGLSDIFSVDVRVRNFQPIAVEKAMYWDSGGEAFAGGTNVSATRLPPP